MKVAHCAKVKKKNQSVTKLRVKNVKMLVVVSATSKDPEQQ